MWKNNREKLALLWRQNSHFRLTLKGSYLSPEYMQLFFILCLCTCTCYNMHMVFLLPLHGFQGSSPGHQTCTICLFTHWTISWSPKTCNSTNIISESLYLFLSMKKNGMFVFFLKKKRVCQAKSGKFSIYHTHFSWKIIRYKI